MDLLIPALELAGVGVVVAAFVVLVRAVRREDRALRVRGAQLLVVGAVLLGAASVLEGDWWWAAASGGSAVLLAYALRPGAQRVR